MEKIGIVGFGVVGKSVAAFLHEHHYTHISVWDQRLLADDEHAFAKRCNAQICNASTSLKDFIAEHSYVIVSPGVDVSAYEQSADKIRGELDLFAEHFAKKTIAITGSLGKTTVTRLLGRLLNDCGVHALIGGNVGIGMLDLVRQQHGCEGAVLELSSFQLERNKRFAPDIAIWTNLYPNHLDRHGTEERYFYAKATMIRNQQAQQVALLWHGLWSGQTQGWANELVSGAQSLVCIYTDQPATSFDTACVALDRYYLFHVTDGVLVKSLVEHGAVLNSLSIVDVSALPEDVTFVQNWVAVFAALSLYGVDCTAALSQLKQSHERLVLEDHHHRIELCWSVGGVDFYDDSKSTVTQATSAAFEKIAQKGRPIMLIIGGMGKGVDRRQSLQQLTEHPMLKKMYCFGTECSLFDFCEGFATLELLMEALTKDLVSGDIVLFSPSGASFDLFKSYKHRGTVFQQLVKNMTLS